jgi:hypothetical protein
MVSVHNYREILPAARLLRHVECYWFRDDLHGTPRHRVLPDGCVDILFSTQNGEPTSLVIVGLMTTPQIVDVSAGHSAFSKGSSKDHRGRHGLKPAKLGGFRSDVRILRSGSLHSRISRVRRSHTWPIFTIPTIAEVFTIATVAVGFSRRAEGP